MRGAAPVTSTNSSWFRGAIFYEVLVRAFQDANADGIGDIQGLIDRLDYLQWLGIGCIWLLPINSSPLRDGGYDVSDYYNVLPGYGSIEDVRRLLEEAHRRSIRVIADLAVNHTSSDHLWFQSARSSPSSPHRDWYVWSDTPDKYRDARVIFFDSEPSNWSWDEQAGAYYWHRFFHHQPDLNYENPEVRTAMLEVVRFWLSLGLDGFRLDAVPYLFEEEGTICENLPATHSFLAELRAVVDNEFPGTLLLAEANQWPVEAVAYFGTEDRPECHMNFHFPLMPRLFMALKTGSREPITDILAQTPPAPGNGQWALFLRNHDELTLEMVTDEERDYMWHEYAPEPRMRLNAGIRRRLAPLLDGSRPRIELMFALLLSLPGAPIIYYGDEIGMGDNISLDDRDGVRTPMQWSRRRNAGFSDADPESLYLPVVTDLVYGYQTVNVEAELANPSSLLHWIHERIELRCRHPAFVEGTLEIVECSNLSIYAFCRRSGDTAILCVNNLSGSVQPVSLELADFAGRTPHDLSTSAQLPVIGHEPYQLEVPAYGFHWFSLEPDSRAVA